MPSIYDLKPAFQNTLRPLVRLSAAAGVTPNQVTVAALLMSAVVGGLIAFFPRQYWPLLVVPPFLFIRMALNAVDGMLAREHAMQSRLGAFLNELGDVVADAALYLPFAWVPGVPAAAVVAVVVLSIISEMAGVVAVQTGASRRYDGPMGKSDRAFAFGLLAMLLGLGVPSGLWLAAALWLVAVLLILTVAHRVMRALVEAA